MKKKIFFVTIATCLLFFVSFVIHHGYYPVILFPIYSILVLFLSIVCKKIELEQKFLLLSAGLAAIALFCFLILFKQIGLSHTYEYGSARISDITNNGIDEATKLFTFPVQAVCVVLFMNTFYLYNKKQKKFFYAAILLASILFGFYTFGTPWQLVETKKQMVTYFEKCGYDNYRIVAIKYHYNGYYSITIKKDGKNHIFLYEENNVIHDEEANVYDVNLAMYYDFT